MVVRTKQQILRDKEKIIPEMLEQPEWNKKCDKMEKWLQEQKIGNDIRIMASWGPGYASEYLEGSGGSRKRATRPRKYQVGPNYFLGISGVRKHALIS